MQNKKIPKAQFFIITAVVLVLIFSGLFAKISDMNASIPRKQSNLMNNYISFVNSYNSAIKDAGSEIEANTNIRQIVDDQKKLFIKKDSTIKHTGSFGFFDGFKEKHNYLEISTADYFFNQNVLELNISPGTPVNLSYNLTKANIEFDGGMHNIFDIMLKANNSVKITAIDDCGNTGTIYCQNQDKFTFYTNKTQITGLVKNINFSLSATNPTKIIIEYIGIRTARVLQISSNNAFIERKD